MSPGITLRTLLVAGALSALAACTGLRSPGGGEPSDACEILPGPRVAADSITVAAIGRADVSRLRSMLSHRETPFNVDCEGRVVPGLATSWEREDGGRRWVFELREDARRPNGAPVTAHIFENAWRQGQRVGPWGRTGMHIDSVVAVDDHELNVYFARPHDDAARLFSDASFSCAVARDEPRYGLLTARPETANDLLAVAVDLMLATDPDVIGYAAARPEFTTVALPWSRTYVLLSTSRVTALKSGAPGVAASSELLDVLARDAVRGDARGAVPPFWWDDLDDCEEVSEWIPWLPPDPAGAQARGTRRVLYDDLDPTARSLAERVVALARVEPNSSPEAAALAAVVPGLEERHREILAIGVDPGTLEHSLHLGSDFAYIVAVPRHVADPCVEVRDLLYRALWLAESEIASAMVPLVDTRDYVIARRDRFGLTVDWYGNIRITR